VTTTHPPSYPEYADLHARATASAAADGWFVDPVKFRRWQSLHRGHDWTISVLGHNQQHSLVEIHMLLIADDWNLQPPLPRWLTEQRAEQQRREAARRAANDARIAALRGEWTSLWTALPVPVTVAYNYSGPNHREGWCQGAAHILAAADLRAGRLHRVAGSALCTVSSNAKHQDFADGQPPEDRWPTCKACLRTASRLTGCDVSTLLSVR